MITFEVIRDRLGFIAIEEAYTTLWGESGANVFQSHAWIMAWQKHLGQDFELVNRPKQNFELLIGVARGDGRLLAVLPMALHRYKGIKLLEWAAQSLSDNCDGFGLQVYFIQIWRAILAAGKPDIIRLKNVRPDAKAVAFLDGCGLTEIPDDLCLLVQSQWPNGEAWFKTLNKKKRNNHSRAWRKLQDMGAVEKVMLGHTQTDIIERLVALKKGWLVANKLESPLIENGPGLLIDLTAAMEKVNKLCMFVLTCNGEIVAGSVNTIHERSLQAFFAAYDPKFDAISPGITVMNEYTREAFDTGFTEIDYLRGAEHYKFEFATGRRMLQTYVVGRTLKGKVTLAAFNFQQGRKARKDQVEDPAQIKIGAAYHTQAGTSRMQTAEVEHASKSRTAHPDAA
jgi:CelD/BcsL family acetyltransferase involved in cellulose biosynthesis